MTTYEPSDYAAFAVTVDLVVLTVQEDALCALAIRRGGEPFKGRWALPGGFVLPDEGLEEAARRELLEETAISMDGVHLEQLATYGDPERDPRMRVVTVAHLALAPDQPTPSPGTDAAGAEWRSVVGLLRGRPGLAFDHKKILADGVERARAKLEYSTLAATFCPPEFTVGELRHVYEVVWGEEIDPRNFHRKVTGAENFLEPTGEQSVRGGGRPAALFRRGPATVLTPPFLRNPSSDDRTNQPGVR